MSARQPSHHLRPEWADRIRELVDEAPLLTPAQLDRLAVLLQRPPKSKDGKAA